VTASNEGVVHAGTGTGQGRFHHGGGAQPGPRSRRQARARGRRHQNDRHQLTGVWNTAKAALPHLIDNGGGSIILISSVLGLKGLFDSANSHPTRESAAPVFQTVNALPVPWVEPVDISNAVLFLASDEARYITGVTLPVDAGALIR
jgi:NAD(P)-dependent dehydrogenase (short-subunit alcohol dehydrogenase family)